MLSGRDIGECRRRVGIFVVGLLSIANVWLLTDRTIRPKKTTQAAAAAANLSAPTPELVRPAIYRRLALKIPYILRISQRFRLIYLLH